jgi:hypothetical protein
LYCHVYNSNFHMFDGSCLVHSTASLFFCTVSLVSLVQPYACTAPGSMCHWPKNAPSKRLPKQRGYRPRHTWQMKNKLRSTMKPIFTPAHDVLK